MARYRVTAPDGTVYVVTAPDGTAEVDVFNVVQSQIGNKAPAAQGPGTTAAALEGAAQGLTFNFADEIEGGARALYKKVTGDQRPLGDLYDESVAIPRARVKAAKEGNPIAFHGGELVGGVAVPGGLARVGVRGALASAADRSLAARTWAGAKEGAAYGAAYGAGAAEGGLPERLTGAAGGATVGGAIGGVMPGAVDLFSGIGSRFEIGRAHV